MNKIKNISEITDGAFHSIYKWFKKYGETLLDIEGTKTRSKIKTASQAIDLTSKSLKVDIEIAREVVSLLKEAGYSDDMIQKFINFEEISKITTVLNSIKYLHIAHSL